MCERDKGRVCVCARERERHRGSVCERERDRGSMRERETEGVCVHLRRVVRHFPILEGNG